MPINLSVKNAPDDVVERLRRRARRNHRSLQGELMAIIEEAVRPTHQPRELSEDQQAFVMERPRALTVHEVLARARTLGLPAVNEAADLVRADRDSGHRGGD